MLAALTASAQAETVHIAQRTLIDWRGDESTLFTGVGLSIRFTAIRDPGARTFTPVLHLRSASGEEINATGTTQYGGASARFAVGELDPANDTPEVLFTSYTGGAHCCTLVVVLSHTSTGWVRDELGPVDGDPIGEFPRDVDGDGTPEIVTVDQNFFYAFDSYAASYAPPVIYQLRHGRLADVSKDRRYERLFQIDYASAKAGCLKHGNGACAALVADGARLGIRDQAWAIMLRSYDRNSNWSLPPGCSMKLVQDECPKGKEIAFTNYPDALNWFLNYYGY